jgi:uncharacterized membrane protein
VTAPAHDLGVAPAARSRTYAAERLIGRLLIAVTYVSVGLLAIGFVLMIADGISPLSGGPPFDAATLGAQVLALDPAGFLWLGLLTCIAAPIGRVIVAAVAYARDGDRMMLAVSVAILAVIAIGVGTALTVTV